MRNLVCLFALALAVSYAANAVAEEKKDAESVTTTTTVVQTIPGVNCGCVPVVNPCQPQVVYRAGLFGVARPVVYAPVYRPYYPVRYYRPAWGYYPYPAYVW